MGDLAAHLLVVKEELLKKNADLRAALAAAEKREAALREALKEAQFGTDGCSFCGNTQRDGVHIMGCRLAALLEERGKP